MKVDVGWPQGNLGWAAYLQQVTEEAIATTIGTVILPGPRREAMLKVECANTQNRPRLAGCRPFFLALIGLGALASAALADNRAASLAVANFDFKDTSGEIRDQTAEHDARLKAFGAALQHGLSDNQKINLVALPCQAEQCTVRDPGLADLSTQARTAGARYLLIGQVHKMSTLVGWVKFAVLDLSDNKTVCDRYLTYRGDTDEAWRRAAEFTTRDIGEHCIP